MSTVATSIGDVPLEKLVKHYETYVNQEKRKYQKRLDYLATPEGKEWNRLRAKSYYERNKQKVLEKRKAAYQAKKETSASPDASQ